MSTLLQVNQLNKHFGAVIAASDINLSIAAQEELAVIGANGAGKTTFINMVTGYLRPTSGEILFRGKNISGLQPRDISRQGLCRSFQVAQLFPNLSAIENVMIALSLMNVGWQTRIRPMHNARNHDQAMQILHRFGIDAHAGAKVSTLAQGIRKLLDISMAMVSEPALLLLDEPTSGVAIDEKMPLMETVMAGVRQSGAAVMFIEHDMEIVSHYAGRTVAFYEGRIIADGKTANVLSDEQVRKFIVGQVQETALAGTNHD